MLRILGRALCRKPLFRRGHRHRRSQGQRSAADVAELGAVPDLGKRPLHRPVAAVFFRQSVLTQLRRVGKGALAPCPPFFARSVMVGTLRVAHPTGPPVILHFAPETLVSAASEESPDKCP